MFRTAVLIISAMAASASAQKPAPTVGEALRTVRHELRLSDDGRLSGDGAALLLDAVGRARLVAIGEDHVTREIPRLVSALCDATAPDLAGLVLEVGPRALGYIGKDLAAADRLERMTAFNARYPSAIAFLDNKADNDMAGHCLAGAPRARLIGIDQEFFGAGGLLLDLILAERLSSRARTEVESLRQREREYAQSAARSGDPRDLLIVKASGDELGRVRAALASGGSARARAIFAELEKSREIYLKGGNASNQDRAQLLKLNLRAQLPTTGKVLLKMGDWHLYRGYNPLDNRDVGNWLAEQADKEGVGSLHILTLGVRGTHALYAGYRRPLRTEPFVMSDDPEYQWLKPALDPVAQTPAGAWTIFDLRPLRDRRLTGIDVPWRRVLDGYDLLILIPELTPSDRIH